MTQSTADVALDDGVLARAVALEAGRALLSVRSGLAGGLAGKEAGARGDAAAQVAIAALLDAARPGDSVLSEEAADDPSRLDAERVWIIDPLDGTREFGEAGRVDWAVHVALWQRPGDVADGDLVAGAVALPALDVILATDHPPVLPSRAADRPLRIAVSRSRPPALVHDVAERTGAELVPMGSAGFKVCAVVRGEVDAYVHGGGQYEWDSAAPVAVARAAGLHTSRLDGSPLRYNRADPLLPDLLVCRPESAGPLLDAVALAGLQ
jgi:3'(2'), 5'-bisphosphate nucleotidase